MTRILDIGYATIVKSCRSYVAEFIQVGDVRGVNGMIEKATEVVAHCVTKRDAERLKKPGSRKFRRVPGSS